MSSHATPFYRFLVNQASTFRHDLGIDLQNQNGQVPVRKASFYLVYNFLSDPESSNQTHCRERWWISSEKKLGEYHKPQRVYILGSTPRTPHTSLGWAPTCHGTQGEKQYESRSRRVVVLKNR